MKYTTLLLLAIQLAIQQTTSAPTSKNILINTKGDAMYNYFPLCTDRLEFTVKATKNVHIVLTTECGKTRGYYEIIFGGWSNTKSVIRKEANLKVENTEVWLVGDEFETLWVSINATGGTISAGKGNGNASMVYHDPSFVKMNYFAFTTGQDAAGQWSFGVDLLQCEDRRLLDFLKLWVMNKN